MEGDGAKDGLALELASVPERLLAELTDEERLLRLGYRQEYKRSFTWWTSMGLACSMISVLLGIVPLYDYSVSTGGPAVMLWSWVGVGCVTLVLVSCLAEISSAYPTMGALYYWAHQLGGPRYGRFSAWTAGWANLIGQFAGVASGGYSGAVIIASMVQLRTGVVLTPGETQGVFAAVLVVAAVVNTFSPLLLGSCTFSFLWHVAGVMIIVIWLNVAAEGERQPAVNTVTEFYNGTGFTSNVYVTLIGMLAAASTFTGYDTAAHVAEETHSAHNAAPFAMLGAVINCLVLGSGLILGLNAALPSVDDVVNSGPSDDAVVNLWSRVVGTDATILFLTITLVGICASNCANLTSAARMVYALSRDRAVPFSQFFHHVSSTNTPVRSIWLCTLVAFLMGLPGLGNQTVLSALFSLTGTGLYTSYAVPILLRCTVARDTFQPAEFSLGRWSVPMGAVSVVWILFMMVVLCLPQATPQTAQTLNYAPVMLGGALVIAWIWWAVSARRWFKVVPTAEPIADATSRAALGGVAKIAGPLDAE